MIPHTTLAYYNHDLGFLFLLIPLFALLSHAFNRLIGYDPKQNNPDYHKPKPFYRKPFNHPIIDTTKNLSLSLLP